MNTKKNGTGFFNISERRRVVSLQKPKDEDIPRILTGFLYRLKFYTYPLSVLITKCPGLKKLSSLSFFLLKINLHIKSGIIKIIILCQKRIIYF
jgi:hypothetical protein